MNKMTKLIINGEEKNLETNSSIIEACEEAGIPFACTEGVCGTCCVNIISGDKNLSSFTEAEKDFFGEEESERLACQCKILQDTVEIEG